MGRAKKLKLIRKIASIIPPEKKDSVHVIATAGVARRMGYTKEIPEGMAVGGPVDRAVNHYRIMKKMNYGQAAAYLAAKLPAENDFVEKNISSEENVLPQENVLE